MRDAERTLEPSLELASRPENVVTDIATIEAQVSRVGTISQA